jgi:hypothetical protein
MDVDTILVISVAAVLVFIAFCCFLSLLLENYRNNQDEETTLSLVN